LIFSQCVYFFYGVQEYCAIFNFDLKKMFSYWERTSFIDNADIIIIGSGLVGLSAALHLKKQQPLLKVLVLERGFLPSGASTKNAGFACFGTVSEQIEVINRSSEAEAMHLVDYKWRGLQRLRQNLGDKNIDYHQHGGHELFMVDEPQAANIALDQVDHLNKLLQPIIGTTDIYAVANEKIADFGFNNVANIIYNHFEGQIDTGKMMRTLLYKVFELGVLVLNNVQVSAIEHEATCVRLQTTQGNFKAGKVVLATNAFAGQLYPELDVVPGRGQVLVTKPVDELKLKGTYHFNDGYYYFRNIDNRVLFGGGRNLNYKAEETWEFGHTDEVKEKLFSYLAEVILPDQKTEVDYWWSGIMGFGEQLSPIVKAIQPNVFCAVRCNGMGVAMGSLVGEEVAELVFRDI
jgi:glycine/D-amino acid oxidase-like deaminating enzyme